MSGFRFANTTDNIDFGDQTPFDGKTALSLAMKFVYSGTDGDYFSKWAIGELSFIITGASAGAGGIRIFIFSSALVAQDFESNTGVLSNGNTYYLVATWHSSTGTGQDVGRIHLNGSSIARNYNTDGNQGGLGLGNVASAIRIGSAVSGAAGSADFDALYVAAWDRELSGAEITALAGGDAPSTIPSGLIWDTPLTTNPPTEDVGSFTGTVTGATFLGSATPPTVHYAGSPFSKTQGVAVGNNDPTLDSGDAATSYAQTSGTSFATYGLALDTSTGRITGTPITGSTGTHDFGVTASNAAGAGPETTVRFVIANPTAPTLAYSGSPFVDAYRTDAHNYTHSPSTLTGFEAVLTASGLPTGYTINSSTGVITAATPTILPRGAKFAVVTATNDGGTASATVSLECVVSLTLRDTNADGSDDVDWTVHGTASGGSSGNLTPGIDAGNVAIEPGFVPPLPQVRTRHMSIGGPALSPGWAGF